MSKYFERPLGAVEHSIEKGRVIVSPLERIVGVGNLVREQLAGVKILDADRVRFITLEIDGIGEEPVTRTDGKVSDPKVFLTLAKDVPIEQDLLRGCERFLFTT